MLSDLYFSYIQNDKTFTNDRPYRVKLMIFNATFNNISEISWRSVLLVEETGENHRPVASHCLTLSPFAMSGIQTYNMAYGRTSGLPK
jgi:hypothetical protein